METKAINSRTASQVVLDAQDTQINALVAANVAVWEAIRTLLELEEPMAPILFGADTELLKRIAQIPRLKFMELAKTGIPIFQVRIDNKEFVSAIEADAVGELTITMLLRSFSEGLPLKSLQSAAKDGG